MNIEPVMHPEDPGFKWRDLFHFMLFNRWLVIVVQRDRIDAK